jgi:hypothetical protein
MQYAKRERETYEHTHTNLWVAAIAITHLHDAFLQLGKGNHTWRTNNRSRERARACARGWVRESGRDRKTRAGERARARAL